MSVSRLLLVSSFLLHSRASLSFKTTPGDVFLIVTLSFDLIYVVSCFPSILTNYQFTLVVWYESPSTAVQCTWQINHRILDLRNPLGLCVLCCQRYNSVKHAASRSKSIALALRYCRRRKWSTCPHPRTKKLLKLVNSTGQSRNAAFRTLPTAGDYTF